MNQELRKKVVFKVSQTFLRDSQELFNSQKKKVLEIFPNADVEHIGSTAVPNALTKGDVDLQIRILSEDFLKIRKWLDNNFQRNNEDVWSETYASFKDDENYVLPLGIQLTVIGGELDILFQNQQALLSSPEVLDRYNELKERFQNKNMDEYRKAKAEFFKNLNNDS